LLRNRRFRISYLGHAHGPGSPPVVATPYNPQSDDGGQVVPAGEPPAGANQDNGQKSWSDWFLDLVRSPGDDSNLVEGAPKARSDITPQLENDLNSGQPTTPGMLRNDGGENFGHRMGDVKQAMLSDFPKYAAGVMVEVGIDLLAPEEIAALKGLAIAKGFLVREAAKKGGGRVLQFARKKGQDLAGQVKGLLDEFRTSRKAPNSASQLHHPWPKYLGGPSKQALEQLPKSVHDAYHSGLDKILPRQWGTKYYDGLSGAARQQMQQDLAAYTKAFDAKYGTSLSQSMLNNGFSGQ
jgi:hypothetical protein